MLNRRRRPTSSHHVTTLARPERDEQRRFARSNQRACSCMTNARERNTLHMRSLCFVMFGLGALSIQTCAYTQSSSIRPEITEPEFRAISILSDSSAASSLTTFFYAYQFGSREDDQNMTPEWALANLYHGGIKAVEAWYVRSTEPSSHRNLTTGTIYPPMFVVGLATADPHMNHFHFDRIEEFNPIVASHAIKQPVIHY